MEEMIRLFPRHLREEIRRSEYLNMPIEEIRVRVNGFLTFHTAEKEYHLKAGTEEYRMTTTDLEEMCAFLSNYSLYAYEEEIKQGFLTVEGGHRVGICGQVSYENGRIRRIHPIRYLNIRIAREQKGCAKELITRLLSDHKDNSETSETEFQNTLIISPPGLGKTTLLRDMIRMLSNGSLQNQGYKIGLVDERSEIAGCIRGVPQNDVGCRTDVLDNCPKALGMTLLIRSMSPEILAVDEIGGEKDIKALSYADNCGCRLLASVHGSSLEEVAKKPGLDQLFARNMFSYFIVIRKQQTKRVYQIFRRTTDGAVVQIC